MIHGDPPGLQFGGDSSPWVRAMAPPFGSMPRGIPRYRYAGIMPPTASIAPPLRADEMPIPRMPAFSGVVSPRWILMIRLPNPRRGAVGPITKSEPVSIVKPEPPVAAGQGSGCPAHPTTPLGTPGNARSDVASGMGRGGVSPLGSGARTIPVKAVV